LVDLEGADLSPYVNVLGVPISFRVTVQSSRMYKRKESRSSEWSLQTAELDGAFVLR
jgi:hypothetical protein